jgi:transposase
VPVLWDRVHIMVDLNDDTTPQTPRRMEVLSGAERRRQWPDDLKARIVAESLAPGAIVAEVARRYDVRGQQIHMWRKDARDGRLVLPADDGAMFAQVVVAAPAAKRPWAPVKPPLSVLEIEAASMIVRAWPDADTALVETVLRVLKAGA